MSDIQQLEQQPQDGRQTDIGGQQEEEGEMVAPWEMIDRIAEKGVSSSDIKKLKDAGFTTCKSVLWTQKKKMVLHYMYLTSYLDISDCTSGHVCLFRWTLRGYLRQRSTRSWRRARASRARRSSPERTSCSSARKSSSAD